MQTLVKKLESNGSASGTSIALGFEKLDEASYSGTSQLSLVSIMSHPLKK